MMRLENTFLELWKLILSKKFFAIIWGFYLLTLVKNSNKFNISAGGIRFQKLIYIVSDLLNPMNNLILN